MITDDLSSLQNAPPSSFLRLASYPVRNPSTVHKEKERQTFKRGTGNEISRRKCQQLIASTGGYLGLDQSGHTLTKSAVQAAVTFKKLLN